jgi:glycosyltransferase involved in cell wall biosynthesis
LSKPSAARQALRGQRQESRVILSVVIITHNEEANIGRTLASVQPLVADGKGETIVVDCGSTDRTMEIAESFGAKVFVEEWKGYAAQKNSAIDKAVGQWILSLDADEEIGPGLAGEVYAAVHGRFVDDAVERDFLEVIENVMRIEEAEARGEPGFPIGFWISRKNFFLRRWIKHGGFWPDPKLRLFRKDAARFKKRLVHEDATMTKGISGHLKNALLHHSYPTLADYIDHMNRYSSLGAEMAVANRQRGFSLFNIVLRPLATFIYNYFLRLGFLDGREGLLLHLYHAVYVSWKYAKAWELARQKESL